MKTKRKYKETTQKDIADLIGVGQPTVSRILKGEIQVSWPLASKLSELFPEKTIQQWKGADPQEIKRAFEFLKNEAA